MEASESESTDHEIIFDEEEMLTVRPKITASTFTHSTLNVGSLVKDLSDYAIINHEQGTVKLMTWLWINSGVRQWRSHWSTFWRPI